MRLSVSFVSLTIALGATTNANPKPPHVRRDVSGSNASGSIYMFGSASACREIFWQSGACGLSTYFRDTVDPNMPLTAIPSEVFDKYGQAQYNKLCGKVITMTHNGVTRKAVVADKATSSGQLIDMCLDLWQAFGGHDNDGTVIKGFEWSVEA
ncbi:hypothetical protein QQS21_002518 [Conoideocrella luteorostrata]|uniref:Uncharacterized protein n=1 Tax=Conoideocrella luteorostrata TaxID=1105319 RepID=A0AAJ0FWH8_9HYPO|nr:hypothetical protein QQS21_002518 [Conoideocrella luteorostrata]